MKAVIVAGGTPPSEELLRNELKDCKVLIAADSGCNCLYEYNIVPNYLIGDFDSIKIEVLHAYENKNCIIKKYPKDKDFTDSQLAVNLAHELGADNITFLGFMGNRIDHVMGNIGLLSICLNKNIEAVIKDDNNEIVMIDTPKVIEGEKGKPFSLQAYCNMVENLNIKGAKFPLNNYNLKLGDPLTLSNEFEEKLVHISFDKGSLLILYSKD